MTVASRTSAKVSIRMSAKEALRRTSVILKSSKPRNGERSRQLYVGSCSRSSSSSGESSDVLRITKRKSDSNMENSLEPGETELDLHSDDLLVQLPDKVKSALLRFRRIVVRNDGDIYPLPYDRNVSDHCEDDTSFGFPLLHQRALHALRRNGTLSEKMSDTDVSAFNDCKENVLLDDYRTGPIIKRQCLQLPNLVDGLTSESYDKEPLFALGLSSAQIDRLIWSPLWTPISIEMAEDDASYQNEETVSCEADIGSSKFNGKPSEQSWEVAVILRPQIVKYSNGLSGKEYKVIWKNWPWNDFWSLAPHQFNDGHKRIFAADLRERLVSQMAACMQERDKQKFNELFPFFHKRHDYTNYHRVQLRLLEQSINDDLEELDIAPVYFENWTNDERANINVKYLTKCVMSLSNYREAEKIGHALRLQYPEDAAGCDCKDGRCTISCPCVKVLGRDQLRMRSTGKVNVEKLGDAITVGCGTTCSCTVDCPSRFAEKGRRIPLVVLYTVTKGWSVYTPQMISQGTFVGTYTGEIIPLCSAIAKGLPTTYQFTNIHQIPGTKQYVVDASQIGNETRYFNHACGEAANLKAVSLLSRGNLLTNNLVFFTKRTISRGEELTFSYRAKDAEKQKIGMRCLCTPGCQTLL